MKVILLITILILLSSCAMTRLRLLENSGAIKTDFSPDPEYDYIVIMEGFERFGWNANKSEDRKEILNVMFGDRCKGLVLGEIKSIDFGSTQNGREITTWGMTIKCVK